MPVPFRNMDSSLIYFGHQREHQHVPRRKWGRAFRLIAKRPAYDKVRKIKAFQGIVEQVRFSDTSLTLNQQVRLISCLLGRVGECKNLGDGRVLSQNQRGRGPILAMNSKKPRRSA